MSSRPRRAAAVQAEKRVREASSASGWMGEGTREELRRRRAKRRKGPSRASSSSSSDDDDDDDLLALAALRGS